MPHYLVHGTDQATREPTRKIIEAPDAAGAEAMATRLGVSVQGVEVYAPHVTGQFVEGAPGSGPAHGSSPGGPTGRHAPAHAPGAAPGDEGERTVWEGSPSQWVNFWVYVACALLCVLVVPIGYALYRFYAVKMTRFTLTTERLRIEHGVFTRDVEEIELYRVRDTAITQSFVDKLLGLGTVVALTSDTTMPEVRLGAIRDARGVREHIRAHTESMRQRRRVRDIDVS